MVVANPKSVDWAAYFQHIKTECPWSWAAWRKNQIWIGTRGDLVQPLDQYQARMYIIKDITPRQLKKLAQKLDREDSNCEWLWSHPRYRNYSTPVPVLIQQNRQHLNQLRQGLKQT